jgi:AcrR family transcriptional regulator
MTRETARRPYRMKRRAELQERTRLRITESAVELHEKLGPAKTSLSAVAEHAGVPRSTLYRHFPDEAALFAACTAHWAVSNPPPNPEPWGEIEVPDERLRTALGELYAFYGRTEGMLGNVLRDEAEMPMITELLSPYRSYLAGTTELLMAGRRERGHARRRTRAAIGHALVFETWRSLVREQELDEAEAVALMSRLVGAASQS